MRKFEDMTSVERHEASKQFCKKKVNASLCVSMLYVDGFRCRCIGAVAVVW